MDTNVTLDSMLLREECADWLKVKSRYLAEDAMEIAPRIPAFRPSRKVVRYHPRTIIAVLAKRAGVPMDVIAASFGMKVINENSNT